MVKPIVHLLKQIVYFGYFTFHEEKRSIRKFQILTFYKSCTFVSVQREKVNVPVFVDHLFKSACEKFYLRDLKINI